MPIIQTNVSGLRSFSALPNEMRDFTFKFPLNFTGKSKNHTFRKSKMALLNI